MAQWYYVNSLNKSQLDSALRQTEVTLRAQPSDFFATYNQEAFNRYLEDIVKRSVYISMLKGDALAVESLLAEKNNLERLSDLLRKRNIDPWRPYVMIADQLEGYQKDFLVMDFLTDILINNHTIRGTETGELSAMYFQLRNVAINIGDTSKTSYYTEYCLSITRNQVKADPQDYLRTLTFSARIFAGVDARYNRYQQNRAAALYRESLVFDKAHPELPLTQRLETLLSCGEICLHQEKDDEAERLFSQAGQLSEKPVPDSLWRNAVYTNKIRRVGNGFRDLGYSAKAVKYFTLINQKLRQLGQQNKRSYFLSMQDEVYALIDLGDYPQSWDVCLRLVNDLEKTDRYDQEEYIGDYTEAMKSMAFVFSKLQMTDRSVQYYQRSLSFQAKLRGENTLAFADLLAGLALAGGKRQTPASARDAADQAYNIWESYASEVEGLADQHEVLMKLGKFYLSADDLTKADKIFQLLLKMAKVQRFGDYFDDLDWQCGLLEKKLHGFTPVAQQHFLAAGHASRNWLIKNFPEMSAENIRAYRKESVKFNELLLLELKSAQNAALLSACLEADLLNKGLGLRLYQLKRDGVHTAADLLRLNRKSITENLDPGDAAVDFIRYSVSGKARYGAFLLKPGGYLKFFELFSEDELSAQLYSGGTVLSCNDLYDAPGRHSDNSVKLTWLIWQGVLPELNLSHRIYFNLAGSLSYLNMSALSYGQTTLGKRFELIDLLDFADLKSAKAKKSTPFNKFALMGGLNYSPAKEGSLSKIEEEYAAASRLLQSGKKTTATLEPFLDLPEALTEINWVDSLLRIKRKLVLPVLAGSKATKEAFTQLVSGRPEVLQISSHSYLNEFDSKSDKPGLQDDPLDACGIVLSNANGRADLPLGQTMLSGNDIGRLDLRSCQLAVLSVCASAKGQLDEDEGILGLQRAFRMAGVRYMVVSLDPVMDRDALIFVKAFYQNLLSVPPADIPSIFSKTIDQLKASASQAMPHLWANWVLIR